MTAFRELAVVRVSRRGPTESRRVSVVERSRLSIPDARECLVRVFLTAANHWLDNPEAFDALFNVRSGGSKAAEDNLTEFASLPIVPRSYSIYQDTVDAYFKTLTKQPCTSKYATEVLLLATHGSVAIIMRLDLPWTDPQSQIASLLEAQLRLWEDTCRQA